MVPSLPLAPDEVTALLAPLALGPARTLALAVSGGPDSSALAWSLAQHVGPERADLLALIVDHGLRPESAAEADVTLQRLHALGLQGVVLRWTPPPPPRQRLHERARAARYALLLEACRANGRTSLLLAHHRDDQAETVLLRLAKGSGLHGLGGMAPVSTRAGVRLLRPFLSVPKSRLIATCRAAGLPFAEDPSNLSESYARGRLRRVMPLLEVEGLSPERLTDLAERAREDSEALDALMLTFLRANTTFDRTSGTLRLDALAWESCPRALRLRALAACLRAIHPAPFAPRRAGLCALEVALCCATAPDDPWRGARALSSSRRKPGSLFVATRTLGGCLVRRLGETIRFLREPAAAFKARCAFPPSPAQEPCVWDDRWILLPGPESPALSPNDPATVLEVRALGFQGHTTLDTLAPDLRRRVPEGHARATLPALWSGQDLLGLAPCVPVLPVWEEFAPHPLC